METAKQIKILKRVLFELRMTRIFFKESDGLCIILMRKLNLKHYRFAAQYIPLFTRINAKQFGANGFPGYWWPQKDFKSRIRFVKWMIEELKN